VSTPPDALALALLVFALGVVHSQGLPDVSPSSLSPYAIALVSKALSYLDNTYLTLLFATSLPSHELRYPRPVPFLIDILLHHTDCPYPCVVSSSVSVGELSGGPLKHPFFPLRLMFLVAHTRDRLAPLTKGFVSGPITRKDNASHFPRTYIAFCSHTGTSPISCARAWYHNACDGLMATVKLSPFFGLFLVVHGVPYMLSRLRPTNLYRLPPSLLRRWSVFSRS